MLPQYKDARKVIFDGITIDSERFLDFIPQKLVRSINSQEMKITFINGSILQLQGADQWDSIRGTNPFGIVLSEYAYMKDGTAILDVISPILAVNGGWLLIVSTPWGKNHQWLLHKMANELKDWFVLYKKTSEINHVPPEALAAERKRMSLEKYLQEYECSYERGVEGTWFGKELERLKQKGQITSVAWEPGLVTNLSIDIGVNDATTLIWYQVVGGGTLIRIIDCYSNSGLGLDHYAKIIQDKPYRMGQYFAPHDISVREWANNAITRYEKARQLGIQFTILKQHEFHDGIENVLTHFPKMWIDKDNCKSLVDALENYYREWDERRQIYLPKPVRNWATHYCDALRYLCASLDLLGDGWNKDEFNRIAQQHKYGQSHPLDAFSKNKNQWRNF